MRDHGGNLDAAIARFGGAPAAWIDLSTGINRQPWPVPALPSRAWTDLPTAADLARLTAAARQAWGVSGALLPLSGASQPIQLIPQLQATSRQGPGLARVLAPTYNEHAAALRTAGWRVEEVRDLAALAGADLAVVVNPNNPDGRQHSTAELLALQPLTGQLVVDESFADPCPQLSLAAHTGPEGLWVLRSFGKFYGLAGLRLGFALGSAGGIAALSAMAGPWPISGAAIEIGALALADRDWQQATSRRLAEDAARLDRLSPWPLIGGSPLFRLYDASDAAQAQQALAARQIWSRIFPWHPGFIRLGLPAATEWPRITAAFADLTPACPAPDQPL